MWYENENHANSFNGAMSTDRRATPQSDIFTNDFYLNIKKYNSKGTKHT
jgi:hypothetical protein